MKYFLLLLLFPFFSFGQSTINEDSVVHYFKNILNDYRKKNKLVELTVDSSIKRFTESHAIFMATLHKVTHGEGQNHFIERYYREFKTGFGGENCCEVLVPEKGQFKSLKSSCDEMNPIIEKILKNGVDNYQLALYAFVTWKNSKSHNEFMLNNLVTRFNMSFRKSGLRYYFEYVALN